MAHSDQTGAALERINVVGTSGSGKTTFARELARVLDLPYCEMDALSWKPGWVLDGNYTRTLPIKWKRVQAVIWLDPPFLQTVLRRVLARNRQPRIPRAGLLFQEIDHLVGGHQARAEPAKVRRADGRAGVLAYRLREVALGRRGGAFS